MKVHDRHPSYSDFVINEIKTLATLQSLPALARLFPDIAQRASIAYHEYEGVKKNKGLDSIPFIFKFHLDLIIEKRKNKVLVEAMATPNFESVSYSYAICRASQDLSYEAIRKFHFDYAPPVVGQSPKPIYHLQYCGKPTPLTAEFDVNIDSLHPWMSNPRISHVPINLALLVDSIVSEFSDSNIELSRLLGLREWRELVIRNEKFMLEPYYRRISEFLSSDDFKSTKSLLREHCHG
jgi:hypothetical protein